MVADFLSIDKDTVTDFTLQLITLKVLVNKKTAIGYDSLCLGNVDNREIEPTPETKSDKIDGDFVKYTILSSKNINTIVTQIHKPSAQQEILTFEKFETLLTRHFHLMKKSVNSCKHSMLPKSKQENILTEYRQKKRSYFLRMKSIKPF